MSAIYLIIAVVALLGAAFVLLQIGRNAVRQVATIDKVIETNNKLLSAQHALFAAGRGSASSMRDTQLALDRLWKLRIESARMARRFGSGGALPEPPEPSLLAPVP